MLLLNLQRSSRVVSRHPPRGACAPPGKHFCRRISTCTLKTMNLVAHRTTCSQRQYGLRAHVGQGTPCSCGRASAALALAVPQRHEHCPRSPTRKTVARPASAIAPWLCNSSSMTSPAASLNPGLWACAARLSRMHPRSVIENAGGSWLRPPSSGEACTCTEMQCQERRLSP